MTPVSSCRRARRVYWLRSRDALQIEDADALATAARGRGEILGNEHRAAERGAHAGDPAGEIDRRPDHREVEPRGAADVAIHHIADMERDAEGEGSAAGAAPLAIAGGGERLRLGCGCE